MITPHVTISIFIFMRGFKAIGYNLIIQIPPLSTSHCLQHKSSHASHVISLLGVSLTDIWLSSLSLFLSLFLPHLPAMMPYEYNSTELRTDHCVCRGRYFMANDIRGTWGLIFPDIAVQLRKNPRKNLCRSGIELWPVRWEITMLPCYHSAGLSDW